MKGLLYFLINTLSTGFVLMFNVPVNNFSVVSRQFSGLKQWIKCLAQGHNTVIQVSL